MTNRNPSTIDHIQKIRRIIVRLNLPRPKEFDLSTDEQIQSCYNGIGSDKFGWALKITTSIFSLFEPSACIHDFGWTVLNWGIRTDYDLSNKRFEEGNEILAKNSFVWLGWVRGPVREERECFGHILASVVKEDFAWRIYLSSAQRTKPVAG